MVEPKTKVQKIKNPEQKFCCSQCRKLLAKNNLPAEALEIKCHRCGTLNLIKN